QQQQEQQILFQQFQMLQELRRHEITQINQVLPSSSDITINGEAPKYEDPAKQRKEQADRIQRYTNELNELYTRYQEAETNFQAIHDNRYLAMVYNNMGVVYTSLEQWDEAEATLQLGIALHKRIEDKKAWINTKGNLGIAYLKQDRYTQAIQTFQEALAELQTTTPDPEHERLGREITKYLTQAQERYQEQKKR
ncbi:MAG: tetratricopeptide repeat protein, partial [Caldilinea sp. CFX5]|nr:tetratricopeptide repeat protein [Caldilinea sp. CFX5]